MARAKKEENNVQMDFMSALDDLARERNINKEKLIEKIEAGLVNGYKKNFNHCLDVHASIDRKTSVILVSATKKVVDEVEEPQAEISLEDARQINPVFQIGDLVDVPVNTRDFGRIAAQIARQVIVQHIHEAERGQIYEDYIEKENEILTAIVQRVEGKQVYVDLSRTQGLLEPAQQMPGETYEPDDRLKVYVLEVRNAGRGPQVMVSRTHSGLVKRLFELEVPEIRDGIVQIKAIAREAGFRTKMSVLSTDAAVDPVGSCVGPRGTRVENVVNELKTEKIDIIKYSSDPAEYIANALNPARVLSVFVSDTEKMARVIVPDNQLSLAIGKEGQNARLAAKLTGWKIDIKSQSQAEEAVEQAVGEETASAEETAEE